jgi:hypothetical protein
MRAGKLVMAMKRPCSNAPKHRRIKLVVLPTSEAIAELEAHPDQANAILHVTC